ncbi:Uncharacterised protein [Nocardia farcinica]|uniref:helix-turn-helix domain-containing protein n=1 Tax=Nocardia farcinica TaxID=37329 RepID=UPI000DFF93F6|nr:DNA-binding protein [Nocardia farcinica]SUE27986.1 Uncharacterised protein [Nocardia farcinica]
MIVERWSGVESKALREAMHLSIEKFSARTSIAPRTIAEWEEKGPRARLRPSSQALLEKTLLESPTSVAARFARLLSVARPRTEQPDPNPPATVTLTNDPAGRPAPIVLGSEDEDPVWVHARTLAGEVVLVSLPRRTVLAGFGVGALAAAVGTRPVSALASCAQIDHAAHFSRLRLSLIESDNLHGSQSAIPLVEQNLQIMNELRRGGIGDMTQMQRLRILYAELAAWLHQDGRNWSRAQHWTDRALTWSHQLGDSYYIAAALIRKAQLANDQGDGTEAIELAEAAERAAPPRTRFQAVAATYAGFGAALIGDRTGSERAFDRARRHLHDADHDASWGFFLDEPYIAAHEAHGKLALGSYRIAAEQFSDAISAMRPEYLRDQAVYLSRQAVAYARTGQFEPAAHVGLTALRVGVSTGSERVLHNVRQLHRLLGSGATTEVVEFKDAARQWEVVKS